MLFVALLVASVVFAIRINARDEDNILSVRRPDAAIRAGGNVRDLMRFAVESAALRREIAHPDLRRIGRFRSPDQLLPVGRKARTFFFVLTSDLSDARRRRSPAQSTDATSSCSPPGRHPARRRQPISHRATESSPMRFSFIMSSKVKGRLPLADEGGELVCASALVAKMKARRRIFMSVRIGACSRRSRRSARPDGAILS